jgi:ABC-type bacteriocin/lantibiotic exporter with double-glycine peptidase domain
MRCDAVRILGCLVALYAIAFCDTTVGTCKAGPEEKTKLDCGVNVLFILLRLEGRSIEFDRLESALAPRNPAGSSMAELAGASASLGLTLDGIRFDKDSQPLAKPAIAFFKDSRGGHFAVLRPVGTTGRMIQVINPPYVPFIADRDQVVAQKAWTGRVLVSRDSWI